ncbi:MAG TPA: VOC family protein [Thermoanaerobaculia bacterium]|nr:VOC family protein [Thermoanaerobaculia bacterium]
MADERGDGGSSAHRERRQPETLRLRTVTPTLTVNDIAKSLAFYRDALGFVEGEHWEAGGTLQGVQLRAGDCELYLTQDDWKKGRDRTKGVGIRLHCDTAQDVDALAARIRAAGGTLTEEPTDRSWGLRELTVADPDGFLLSIGRPL